jgi:anti-sigma factor RsiW
MCDERERLIGYVYGESDPDDRRAIERHLDDCDICRVEIRDLRRTREDLLAWDVPEHGSVWTPFAPPAPPAWYKQVPAWAMAAAASVMFVSGAAGGLVTHAWLGGEGAAAPAPALTASAPADGVRAVPASTFDQQALEQRMLELFRQELDNRLAAETRALAASNAGGPAVRSVSNGISLDDFRALQREQNATRDQFFTLISTLTDDVARINQANQQKYEDLRNRVNGAVLRNASTTGGPGNQ